MTDQIEMDFDKARELGERGAQRALDHAERGDPGFGEAALRFIERHVAKVGRMTCEQCTRAANAAGIAPPDNRAFGSPFSKAAKLGLVQCVGMSARVLNGHAAPGARIYVPGPNNQFAKGEQ